MTARNTPPASAPAATAALGASLAVLAGMLGYAVWSLRAASSAGLGSAVQARIEESGVESPVTAVLMNFRAYDTLLELTVLFVAYAGIRVGQLPARVTGGAPSPVLGVLYRLLVPFLTLFAAYLLWAGSQSSGGAFQAGAVLGAAGVLVALSGEAPRVPLPAARGLIIVGPGIFAVVAAGTLVAGRGFLDYPVPYAKGLILLIETAAMLSIGGTLLALLLGGGPAQTPEGEPRGR